MSGLEEDLKYLESVTTRDASEQALATRRVVAACREMRDEITKDSDRIFPRSWGNLGTAILAHNFGAARRGRKVIGEKVEERTGSDDKDVALRAFEELASGVTTLLEMAADVSGVFVELADLGQVEDLFDEATLSVSAELRERVEDVYRSVSLAHRIISLQLRVEEG